jgi:ketosteroid isomerase-like protein
MAAVAEDDVEHQGANMTTPAQAIIDLENKFWKAIVDQDSNAATRLLAEPALMVSEHGSMKFDHAGYRKMAEQGSMILTSYELSDMEVVFPNDATAILTYKVKQSVSPRDEGESAVQQMNDTSTWVRDGERWRCVMHTETPSTGAKH